MSGPKKFEEIGPEHLEKLTCIGRGAFGNIYRSRYRNLGMDVAVKIPNSGATFSREELLREARAMHEARSPYVLHFFALYVDLVQQDGPTLGLVMEYMENGNLSDLREKVSFVPWALRFRILHEVALGMNFLHNLRPPLLHMDLKPSNVLLGADLHARVADFGLSRFKRGTTRLSNQSDKEEEEEGYGGTLAYLPPEVFVDLNCKPTLSTDVYSYGILIWSVLNGQEPYTNVPLNAMSSLISRLIPNGQRPKTEELESISGVQKLENMIMLMKSCWHNEKTKRPSFLECTQEAEDVYESHKPQILAAVREVQDTLLHSNCSSSKKTQLPSNQDRRRSPPKLEQPRLPSYAPELEQRLATMDLLEPPSCQIDSVPAGASTRAPERKLSAPHRLQRSQSACHNQAEEEEEEEESKAEELFYSEVKRRSQSKTSGVNPRPHSYTLPSPSHLPHHPGELPYPQQACGAGLTHPDHPLAPHSGVECGGASLQNCYGIQIGNGNTMCVERIQRFPPASPLWPSGSRPGRRPTPRPPLNLGRRWDMPPSPAEGL